ncbi:CbaC protein [Halogeometricum sp. CBA1124]|uniref:CbaC protein n=1 Tax=Halogeometricum sp. CBA1124 TaxID=2668071 RepID=UPI0014291C67|nr:CbaC protein [Halogeometricum sp. CBA1124]MUV57035.1 CbaC protein [Halogeometricum sp. CBA1124]
MRRLSPALLMVLAAFTVPVAIEMRTVAGFFGYDLPLVAVAGFELLLLGILLVVYLLGETEPADDADSASPR